MKRDRSDMFYHLEFARFARQHSFGNDTSPSENKGSNSTTSTAVNTHASEKGIIFALGFIATLLFVGGLQLYRCVNPNPIRVKEIAPDRAFTFKTENSTTEIPAKKFKRFASSHKIKTLSIQNAISHGKF